MTKPRYQKGCAVRSKVHGEASSSPYAANPDYAWIVNFNNGNTNWNHRDNNNAFVRAVRSVPASEYQGASGNDVSLQALHRAWVAARKKKRPSHNQLSFEVHWIDRLLDLQQRLAAHTWSPSPAMCFIATKPKAREIHAPDFSDRVVHHWLVPQIEAAYQGRFIHDSYSNRKGKGTHAAVDRVRTFMRQVHSGEGGGWFLQLDIRNFFNAIHRPTLYTLLKRRLTNAAAPAAVLHAVHALLRSPVSAQGVRYRVTVGQHAQVPPHKRLENSAPGCGIPIGNLSSQFFANVYLDRLDQFVKHILNAKRYVRYVDDFVLVHHDRAQLVQWQAEIVAFLQRELRLELKEDIRLQRIESGIDFLGYIVRPTHTLVRRRVVGHARDALKSWGAERISAAELRATPSELRQLASVWRSYEGHFAHAASRRLLARFHRRFPWLASATRCRRFDHRTEHREIAIAWAHQRGHYGHICK